MASPILTITSFSFKGRQAVVEGSCVYAGSTSLQYFLVDEAGASGVATLLPVDAAGKFSLTFSIVPGKWAFKIVATPSDSGTPAELTSATQTLTRVSGRAVMPLRNGVESVSPAAKAVKFDRATRANYRSLAVAVSAPNRRTSLGNQLAVLFGLNPVLRIFRNNRQVVNVVYDGLLKVTTVGSDVFLAPSSVKNSSVLENADLTTGSWRFSLQATGMGREITGSVGPTGSDSHIVLDKNPTLGMGFSSEFKFLLPASIESLVA